MSSGKFNTNIGKDHPEPQAPIGNVNLVSDMKIFKREHEKAIEKDPTGERIDILRARRHHVMELISAIQKKPDFSEPVRLQYEEMLRNPDYTGAIDSETSGDIDIPYTKSASDSESGSVSEAS